MKVFIIAISILFFVGCESIENKFGQKSAKEKCEETPCTDSLCLHWDDSLQRCGTESALIKEKIRMKREIAYIFNTIEDSTEIKQLESINKYLELKDSLTNEVLKKLKENKEKTDSIYFQMRMNNFCRYMKSMSLFTESYNLICPIKGKCVK